MNNEITVRLSFFFGIFTFIALWEIIKPRRDLTDTKWKRWLNNISIIVLNTAIVRIAVPLIPITVAYRAAEANWGLFNKLNWHSTIEIVCAFMILDFIIYLQHLMFHAVPILWRLHMVHHADLDIDVTSGLRFHPIEIVISILIKISVIAALGPSIISVIAFEIALNGSAMFNHGNIYINPKIDAILRLLVVTPDMHRVHHSVAIRETNSNFGFNLPLWDRIMGTYRAQSFKEHKDIVLGLSQYRKHLSLLTMLIMPFNGKTGNYPINRWGKIPKNKK